MNISLIFQKPWAIPVAAGVAGLGVGLGVGFFAGRKYELNQLVESLSREVDTRIQVVDEALDETEEMSEEDQEEFAEALLAVELPQPEPDEEEIEPVTITRNVFQDVGDEQWVYEDEIAQREGKEMYVIHYDEFVNNENDYEQETLTYYIGDDIVADQSDKPIYNYNGLMGDLKFGHGSGDKNVVYIRNDKIHMEWEILRHEGSFEIEVLGLQVEKEYEEADLKHDSNRRFRPD